MGEEQENPTHVSIFKKIHRLERARYAFLDRSKTLGFCDFSKKEILQVTVLHMLTIRLASHLFTGRWKRQLARIKHFTGQKKQPPRHAHAHANIKCFTQHITTSVVHMSHTFGHPVAICCIVRIGSSLKTRF